MMRPRQRRCSCALGLFLLAFSLPAPAQSQASVDSIKAGFAYNFVKFTEWPAAAAGGSLRLCALERNPLDGQFALLQGRHVNNRPIEVRLRVSGGELASCHLLFLAGDDGERSDAALKAVAGLPVLTVSDQPGFAQRGGMIELHEREGRMRFEVNLAAAQSVGLRLSSQMLKLASKVWQ
ncbi:MAG: YfiR family protein [Pseudomonadota bacterium]|jgi:hypothetical protein